MGDEPDYLLLDRYFAGECTPAEDAVLQRWIAERPDRRNWVEDLRAMRRGIHLVPNPAPVVDVNAEWVAFATEAARSGQRDAQDRVGAPSSPHTVPQPWRRGVGAGIRGQGSGRSVAVAVSVVLVAIGVGLLARRSLVRDPRSLSPAVREYATAAGQRLSVTLVDGTRFTLAPASRVRVGAEYGRGERRVTLEGEAYFAVVHDAAHPFVVRARGAAARDVGTAFDVRAYPEDVGARIAVAEGAVAVTTMAGGCRIGDAAGMPTRAISPVALSHLLATQTSASTQTHAGHDRRGEPRGFRDGLGGPRPGGLANTTDGEDRDRTADGPCMAEAKAGDVATVGQGGGVAIQHGVDMGSLTGWRAGRLVFADAPVADVVRELARWYGVRIELGDRIIGSRPYTATLDGESVAEAVDAVCRSVVGRYERRGDEYVLYAARSR